MTFNLLTGDEDLLEEVSVMESEKIVFEAADANKDGGLTKKEFLTFYNPNRGV